MLSNSDSAFLPAAHANEFLPPISRWTKVSGLVMVAAVALAIPLASITNYKVTVKGQATVRPTGELRLVQAATEGAIMQISATENQHVQKGDAIAIIDDSRLQTQKSQLQANIQQTQLQLLQINAQISALNNQILAETDRRHRAMASAEAELRSRRRDYQDQQANTSAKVIEAEANLRSVEAALNSARSKRDRYQTIADTGAISKERFEEAQLAVEQQEQAAEVAQAQLQQAQTALNPSDAAVAIAAERIAQEYATGTATLAALNKDREALIQQRIQVQNQLDRDTHELQQVEFDLGKTTVTATTDGVIAKLNLRNSGQIVRPGEEIAQIAPSNTELVVKTLVSAQSIGKVEIGQMSQIRVSACPYPDYGTLKGKVSLISPDAIAPQSSSASAANPSTSSSVKTTAGGNAFYEVTIEPEDLSLGQGDNPCSVQLGMEGRADIISREESFLQFLLRKARLMTDL